MTHSPHRRTLLAGTALAAIVTLAGCIVVPRPHRAAESPGGEIVYVDPPPDRYEDPGFAPAVGYIWLGGYWNWGGGRWGWAPGRWAPGRPGYDWAPTRWQRDGRGWRAAPGHWRRR